MTYQNQQVAVWECRLNDRYCDVDYIFLCRFYIDKFTFLKETTTVELFFLNAKSLVYKVSVSDFMCSVYLRPGFYVIKLLCCCFYGP